MQIDIEKKLQEDFPFMRRDVSEEEQTIYTQRGCECGEGWFQLIYDLCQEISDRYEKAGEPMDIVVYAIFKKFSSLQFAYGYKCDTSYVINIRGKLKMRIYKEGCLSDVKDKLRKEIAEIVLSYAGKSLSVCEVCGNTHHANGIIS